MAKSSIIFSAGIPTAADVANIRAIYPDSQLTIGQKISYDDIEQIINTSRDKSRFKTVTSAWRRAVERESGLYIGTIAGTAFEVLDEPGKLGLASSKYRQSLRLTRRANIVTSAVNRSQLTDDEKRSAEFISTRSAHILSIARIKREQQLPQI